MNHLIIEYLRQPTDGSQLTQYFVSLNKALISGYSLQCQGKWSKYPQDHYYYRYLIHHAVNAQDSNTLQNIMKDIYWMTLKVQSDCTIYNLFMDMEMAIDYLRSLGIEVCHVGSGKITSCIL